MSKYLILLIMVLVGNNSFSQSKQERKLTAFNKVLVSNFITLHLTQGENHSVYVEAHADDQDKIITEVIANKLIIRRDNKRKKNFKDGRVVVYLTFSELQSLEVSSRSTVIGDVPIKTSDFTLVVSEASNVNMELTASAVNVTMSSASSADLYLNTEKISGKLSEASHLKIKGKYGQEKIETQSASSVERF